MHKTTSTDDKRLQNTLKRLGVNTIPGIEEVNIFKDDAVIHFVNPKGGQGRAPRGVWGSGDARRPLTAPFRLLLRTVQASIAANTYVISGPSQQKSKPGIWRGAWVPQLPRAAGRALAAFVTIHRDSRAAARHPEPDGSRQPCAPPQDDGTGTELPRSALTSLAAPVGACPWRQRHSCSARAEKRMSVSAGRTHCVCLLQLGAGGPGGLANLANLAGLSGMPGIPGAPAAAGGGDDEGECHSHGSLWTFGRLEA